MKESRFCTPGIYAMVYVFLMVVCVQEVAYSQASGKTGNIPALFVTGKPAYVIADPITPLEKRIVNRLSGYLSKVLKRQPVVLSRLTDAPVDVPAIVLSSESSLISSSSEEAFMLETKTVGRRQVIFASGKTERGLKRAVQRLVILSEQRSPGLVIPSLHVTESPWIPQREWTICPWTPGRVRRSFANPAVDKKLNIWLYSDQQINDYVEMFDWFGFSGCQLMETSANYAAMGTPGAFRDRLLRFAKAIRENGQHVTYWVWAAQFDDYGWFDPEVTYKPQKGNTAFNDPQVRATFEKYYNGYAKMAPYVDLLIAHFYDPGSLTNREDVFSYLGLLQNKFRAKNQNVKMGVDFWAAGSPSEYMQQLIDHGYTNSLLLEMSLPNLYPGNKRKELHEAARQHGLKMGMWGWYMTEYETDQMPMMHVNTKALKDFYQHVKTGAHAVQPFVYWSEMEAYHLNNIFTMYSAAQLLWNPDRDPDDILREIAYGIWGPHNGPLVLEALKLIQDTRSGPTWNTFWWTTKDYRLGTPDPKQDKDRAAKILTALQNMKTDIAFVSKFPLPFSPSVFVNLTIPHLRQIKAFAEFRIREKAIREAAKKGASRSELTRLATEAWKPVPDYNTWVGSFGQPEATMQEKMIDQLAKDLHLEINTPADMRYRNANRYLQRIRNIQRNRDSAFIFSYNGKNIRSGEFIWPEKRAAEYFDVLIREGLLEKVGDDCYQLADWEEYRLEGQP